MMGWQAFQIIYSDISKLVEGRIFIALYSMTQIGIFLFVRIIVLPALIDVACR